MRLTQVMLSEVLTLLRFEESRIGAYYDRISQKLFLICRIFSLSISYCILTTHCVTRNRIIPWISRSQNVRVVIIGFQEWFSQQE